MDRNYRTAQADTTQDSQLLIRQEKKPTQPTHLWGQLICKLKGGVHPPGGIRNRFPVSSAPVHLCCTVLPVLPGSNEKLVNS